MKPGDVVQVNQDFFGFPLPEKIESPYWFVTFVTDDGKGVYLNDVLNEHPIDFLLRPRSIPYVIVFAMPITEVQYKRWNEET